MRKKLGIALIIILSLLALIYFRSKINNEKLDDKNNSNVMSEEVKANIINKNSNDLYRDVIISQTNDFHGRKLNSQFSFTLLLEKDDKIKFQDPKDYEIKFRLLEDGEVRKFFEYQILSEDFELAKDYQGIEHFRFYLTYSIKEDMGKSENNGPEIYSLHGEINLEDI
ncbi:hypothetical protein [Peptoniphilus gorbachii]|uniref:Uncharacterized protein n=1 Tax=Peptoniphilus gorbachii TaxID=411567 RepID=A0A6N3BUP0_9FIRM